MNPSQAAQHELHDGEWTGTDIGDLVVALAVTAGIAGIGGYAFGEWLRESRQQALAAAPRPIVDQGAELRERLIPCTKEGFAEYRRICWGRAKSSLIKPKE